MYRNTKERLTASTVEEARTLLETRLETIKIGASEPVGSSDHIETRDGLSRWSFVYEREGVNLCLIANDLVTMGVKTEVVGSALVCSVLKATQH